MTAYVTKDLAVRALRDCGFIYRPLEADWVRHAGSSSESRAIIQERDDGYWLVEPTRIGSIEIRIVVADDALSSNSASSL